MLVTLKEILQIAENRKIAVGAFNAANLESLQANVAAAEELKVPMILQFAQCHEEWIPLKLIGPLMVDFAQKASVPVCVHLDHGETLDYLQQALEIGFTGIMYDGSTLPYGENLANTQEAVRMAVDYGAGVEAELGSMGRRESGAGDGSGAEDETKIYTDPKQARDFVEQTGIDALACSFGTTHGIYLKINYFTYMDKAGGNAAAQYLGSLKEGEPIFFSSVLAAAREGMKENVKTAMKVFAKME